MFETEAMQDLSTALLNIIAEERNTEINPEEFRQDCLRMKSAIEHVIVLNKNDRDLDCMEEEPTVPCQIMESVFTNVEQFRGIVHDHHISAELAVASEAKAALMLTVLKTLTKLEQLDPGSVSLNTDLQLNTVYFKVTATVLKHPQIDSIQLMRPQWSLNKKKQTRTQHYSSSAIEEAMRVYKNRCSQVEQAVGQKLGELRDELSCERVIIASRFSITGQSLIQHSWEANVRNWHLPKLTRRKPLRIKNMWPYWMDCSHEKTVKNSLILNEMVLLTGPNMAGKSTVLRSAAAVAILALAGLYAPAENVQCPILNQIVLRSFSGDNPFHQHSSFSMEMAEMREALEHCTHQSLILIDELGKGTEVKTGAGLSGAFLEYFAEKRCIGMFSTHLHLMKKMPIEMTRVSSMKMKTYAIESDEENSPLKEKHFPEWTVAKGHNFKSLGIQVAWECGLEAEIISRACQYEEELIAQPSIPMTEEIRPVSSHVSFPSPVSEPAAIEKRAEISSNGATNSTVHEISELLISFCKERGIIGVNNASLQVYRVKENQQPPPFTAQRACLYIYRRACGHHYVGETDNLKNRLLSHQRKKLPPGMDRRFETWYVCIPKSHGAKSMSRAIEKDLTTVLRSKGYLLESDHDASNRSFGIRD